LYDKYANKGHKIIVQLKALQLKFNLSKREIRLLCK